MLKLYCYPCFRTCVYKNTQPLKPRIKMIRKVHICTEMLEHTSPKPGSLAPNEIGRATSIVTSRHIRARYDSVLGCPITSSKLRHRKRILSHDFCKYQLCLKVSKRSSIRILYSVRFNSSLVSVSLFLSKSKNSSGMASAVGSSSGS